VSRSNIFLTLLTILLLPGLGSRAFANRTTSENAKPGTPHWQITDFVGGSSTRDPELAGFATEASIPAGAALPVKVHRAGGKAGKFAVDVYRLGYYQGIGARQVAPHTEYSVGPQQPCVEANPATRLVECSAWPVGFTLQTAADWMSGFYLAKLTDETGKQSYVFFVVRNDERASDIVLQINLNCAQAYNSYGGYSLYEFNSLNRARAYQVSYDRPFMQGTYDPGDFNNPLRWEFPMLYWLESKGYDLTYVTNTDFQNPVVVQKILSSSLHKIYLCAGHDEYWTMEERRALQAARDRDKPLNLAFFSANTGYWRVRLDPSPATQQPNRTISCYKDAWILDPMAKNTPANATNLYRSLQVNLPENGLLGVMYSDDNAYAGLAKANNYRVPASSADDPYFTGVGFIQPTGLVAGSQLDRLVGFEWDTIVNNGAAPDLKVLLASTFGNIDDISPDLGNHPLFTDRVPESTVDAHDGPKEAGFVFETDASGLVASVRYWRAPGDFGVHYGRIWTVGDSPTVVALTKFDFESPEGWQRSSFIPPVALLPHQKYIATVNSNGPLAIIGGDLKEATTMGHVTALANGGGTGELTGYPGWNPSSDNYLRDIDFIPDQTAGKPTVNVYAANAVRYTRPNGAKVVSIGSINWPWGLANPESSVYYSDPAPRVNDKAIAFTENVLADLGARPAQ